MWFRQVDFENGATRRNRKWWLWVDWISLIGLILAGIGVVIPVAAFLWEFVYVGRKRLGWRVQMDTPVTGEGPAGEGGALSNAGVLAQLQPPGPGTVPLDDLSVVLVRIENNGATPIDVDDYFGSFHRLAGLHLKFPKRRVIGMAVTEISDPGSLTACFGAASGFGHHYEEGEKAGYIDLPKVPLNRSDHYKVLAVLRRTENPAGPLPAEDNSFAPILSGRLKGGRIRQTKGRSGVSGLMMVLIGFLVLVIAAQFTLRVIEPTPAPLGCAQGALTVVGSTAFEPVLREAGDQYERRCPGSDFSYAFEGSERGLDRLETDGANDPAGMLAIGDGAKGEDYPAVVERPLAVSLFAVVVNPDTGVHDLTVAQIRDLFAGRIKYWSEIGGANQPVQIVNRYPGSGTRATFEERLLERRQEADAGITCNELRRTRGPGRCQTLLTEDLLAAVAEMPGAIGYSLHSDAVRSGEARVVTIDGQQPTREAAAVAQYPFWGTEYAFSYGDFALDSLGASFLHYLTADTGREVIRYHGNTPCADLEVPVRCRPSA